MNLRASRLRPSYSRSPDFRNDCLEGFIGAFRHPCMACGAELSISPSAFVAKWWDAWRRDFAPGDAECLVRHFDVGTATGASHDGGMPVFLRVACDTCGAAHVAYAGVDEVANGAHAVWVHGFAQVTD